MPQLLDIGDNEYEAAPGNYGPRALLTARGDLLTRDASGPARLALPAAGRFVGSDGLDLLGRIPPGHPIVDLGRAYTPSATTEGSLLAAGAATAGLFAAGVAVGDFWDIELSGTFLNNSGTSTYNSRLRAYYGAYPVLDLTSANLTSSATTREWAARLRILIETLGAAGTGTVRVSGRSEGIDVVLGVGTGWRTIPTTASSVKVAEPTSTSTSPALITNAAQDFNVTATHSNATALMTTTLTECIVRHYPKNR